MPGNQIAMKRTRYKPMKPSDIFAKAIAHRDQIEREAAAFSAGRDNPAPARKPSTFLETVMMNNLIDTYLRPIWRSSNGFLDILQTDSDTVFLGTPYALKLLEKIQNLPEFDGRTVCDAIEFSIVSADYGKNISVQPLNPQGIHRGTTLDPTDREQLESQIARFVGDVFDRDILEVLKTLSAPAP